MSPERARIMEKTWAWSRFWANPGFLISLQNSEEAKPRDTLGRWYPQRGLDTRDLNKRSS